MGDRKQLLLELIQKALNSPEARAAGVQETSDGDIGDWTLGVTVDGEDLFVKVDTE